jgi:hypothetical protein
MYDRMQSRISVGMNVRTLDDKDLGVVKRVHGNTFEIERGLFMNEDHAVALDQVMRIDDRGIVLSVSKRGLDAMNKTGRLGTSLRDRAAGVVDHVLAAVDEAVHIGRARPPKAG